MGIKVDDKMFYSNCFFEALKAKIKNPRKVKLTYLRPSINECFCPHWLWSDGEYDYDFGVERYLKWYERIWFKGQIRQRKIGFNQRWKSYRGVKKKYPNRNVKFDREKQETVIE